MIQLLADFEFHVSCPECSTPVDPSERSIFFQGIHVLMKCSCKRCQLSFYHTLPIGHAIEFPIAFSSKGDRSWYNARAEVWLAKPLIKSIVSSQGKGATFKIETFENTGEAIILNCLDSCFGHVFAKLLNVEALMKNHPDKGIVVLVPANCAWLVPEGVAETWTVQTPLKNMDDQVKGLDDFIKNQLKRFQKVWLSKAYPFIDYQSVSMKKFVKQERFSLVDYSKTTNITFILRQDRFWHNSRIMGFLFKVFVKLKILKQMSFIFIGRQNGLVRRTIKQIKKEYPSASFSVSGLGMEGRFRQYVADQRTNSITPEVEKKWNELYSKSNIVIGVHGSSMLIPTALAAGFINLVPRYKIPHLAEDTALPYKNRYLSFLGRYLDEYSTPDLIAQHAISMISDFPSLFKNIENRHE